MFHKYALYIAFLVCLCACSPSTLHEAQQTVSQADSLWSAGQSCDDSLALAQAYKTLGYWRWFYPDNYVHACYHYGRLLRRKDDPAAAMQTLVNATHTRSHDYHLLGRVYSNMGSICHLANEFALSYDMYDRSAGYFLKNGDTLNYFYGLNNMAFELAEQGKKEEAFSLIAQIRTQCNDNYVLIKTLETQADAYWRAQQYDSAIYCVKELNAIGYKEPTTTLIMAQSYDELHQKDAALLLANAILEDSYASSQNKFNALYIVLHCDSSLCAEDINALASQREDIRYYEYEPLKIKLTNAILILQQDLARTPNLSWLYAIIITSLIIGGFFYWRSRIRKKQMHTQIEQIMERQSDSITQSIKQHIDSNDLENTLHWKNYTAMKADADLYMGGIVSKLESRNLNETEIRFCLFTMLDLSLAQIADTIHYSYPSGIKTLKKRISVKLGTTPQNLRDFLFHMTANV